MIDAFKPRISRKSYRSYLQLLWAFGGPRWTHTSGEFRLRQIVSKFAVRSQQVQTELLRLIYHRFAKSSYTLIFRLTIYTLHLGDGLIIFTWKLAEDLIVVSPDTGGAERARAYAKRLDARDGTLR